MLGGALRSAGDARTPLRLGIWLTVLNLVLSVTLIRGLGPIPAFGTLGAAMGTVIASGIVALAAAWSLLSGRWVIRIQRGLDWRPDPAIIRQLFRFGLPTGGSRSGSGRSEGSGAGVAARVRPTVLRPACPPSPASSPPPNPAPG